MRVSNRIVNLLYESSTKDDKIWKLIDKYEAGEMSKEEVEKEVKRLNKGNKAEIEADLALIFKESEQVGLWVNGKVYWEGNKSEVTQDLLMDVADQASERLMTMMK